jgi:hypothetical protein
LYVNDVTFALVKQSLAFHYPFDDEGWSVTSLLQLFPRLEILSIAIDVDKPQFVETKHAGVRIYQQNLRVTLLKAVTLDDIRGLTLQSDGTGTKGCICLFGAQLATSFHSGWITVSHITDLTVCPGAGIVVPATQDAIRDGRGLQFESTSEIRVQIQEPADEQLIKSTFSLVLDLARVVKHASLFLWCEARDLVILNDTVSRVRTCMSGS